MVNVYQYALTITIYSSITLASLASLNPSKPVEPANSLSIKNYIKELTSLFIRIYQLSNNSLKKILF